MRGLRRGLAAIIMTLLPLAAGAATFGETVMAPKLLSDLPQGSILQWQLDRSLPLAPPEAPPPAGGWRRLTAEEARHFTLTAESGDKLALRDEMRQLAEFPASSPHPMLMMFLENVMRSVSQETGGNPHYIRNRMRTTLGAAEVEAGRLRIAPFLEDPNKSRFGAFADLQIEVLWSADTPGQLQKLTAWLPQNPDLYRESLILTQGAN